VCKRRRGRAHKSQMYLMSKQNTLIRSSDFQDTSQSNEASMRQRHMSSSESVSINSDSEGDSINTVMKEYDYMIDFM